MAYNTYGFSGYSYCYNQYNPVNYNYSLFQHYPYNDTTLTPTSYPYISYPHVSTINNNVSKVSEQTQFERQEENNHPQDDEDVKEVEIIAKDDIVSNETNQSSNDSINNDSDTTSSTVIETPPPSTAVLEIPQQSSSITDVTDFIRDRYIPVDYSSNNDYMNLPVNYEQHSNVSKYPLFLHYPKHCIKLGVNTEGAPDLLYYERNADGSRCCPVCKKSFIYDHGLRCHFVRVHLEKKRFTCPECDRGFWSNSDLARHMPQHTGERFICDTCNRSYKSKQRLTEHFRNPTSCWLEPTMLEFIKKIIY